MLKPLTVWIATNWKILKEMGIPVHLICLLRNLYAGQEAKVYMHIHMYIYIHTHTHTHEYLYLAALDLHCCTQVFSVVAVSGNYFLVEVHGMSL